MSPPNRILVFHTAFIGDIILALPLVQVLRVHISSCRIAFVAAPAASEVLRNHPAIDEIIPYDKRGKERGPGGMFALARRLRERRFDLAIVPHRSLRSAVIPWLAHIRRRIGFDTSAAPFLFTDTVPYRRDLNEIGRNLSLATPLGIEPPGQELPALFPNEEDRIVVQKILETQRRKSAAFDPGCLVAVAPGSVWNTKRWPLERFRELCRLIIREGASVVLIGGTQDEALCRQLAADAADPRLLDASGKLTLLQSAEMIRRCEVAVSNDSAPLHLAVAARTPVVAIFGATVPEFGFAPTGPRDRVMGVEGLSCRPCGIHGGDVCPVGSFACMNGIGALEVYQAVRSIMDDHGRRP